MHKKTLFLLKMVKSPLPDPFASGAEASRPPMAPGS